MIYGQQTDYSVVAGIVQVAPTFTIEKAQCSRCRAGLRDQEFSTRRRSKGSPGA